MPADAQTSSQPPGALPRLRDPSWRLLTLFSAFIVTAVGLWIALVVHVVRGMETWHWWTVPALVLGMAAADFASGLAHWAADTWGRADLPVIGNGILVPFRVHHVNPDDFLRRTFPDTNGEVAGLAIPVVLAMFWIPLETAAGQALAIAGIGFSGLGTMTNQIHQWAHRPTPPRVVALLQTAGLFLRPMDHARHHGTPYDGTYCITTGWCNRPLEAIQFFRRLERLITRVTGVEPRHDELTVWTQNATSLAEPRRSA